MKYEHDFPEPHVETRSEPAKETKALMVDYIESIVMAQNRMHELMLTEQNIENLVEAIHSAMPSESEQIAKLKEQKEKVYRWLDEANLKKNKYLARAENAEKQVIIREYQLNEISHELKEQIATITQLIDKLIEYSDHRENCYSGGWPENKCDCGYYDIINALKREIESIAKYRDMFIELSGHKVDCDCVDVTYPCSCGYSDKMKGTKLV